jgi:hypothetical protein
MTLIAKETITHNGKSFEPGKVVKGLSSLEEERLIQLKSAEKVDTSNFVEIESESNEEQSEITPEEFKALKEKLDNAANKEPLITAAEEVGVELTEEHKKYKETVIEEVILQGLEDEVLGFLSEEKG